MFICVILIRSRRGYTGNVFKKKKKKKKKKLHAVSQGVILETCEKKRVLVPFDFIIHFIRQVSAPLQESWLFIFKGRNTHASQFRLAQSENVEEPWLQVKNATAVHVIQFQITGQVTHFSKRVQNMAKPRYISSYVFSRTECHFFSLGHSMIWAVWNLGIWFIVDLLQTTLCIKLHLLYWRCSFSNNGSNSCLL